MLRGRYELRPIDRLIINLCLRSCNESSEEMSDADYDAMVAYADRMHEQWLAAANQTEHA